ncbi:hypothetical protein IV38_GL001237 [Lactobacillus selangorensis]|uniref:UspA domain-containing protein n=1 Tax=Lactobacillus selangorensis TaxID=81857 RepID=A0A0R2FWJ0_9LACO|nr:universal stress protein [Lactobacillus selangorensis]KRN29022.1 hypothetical protein IV38_GL001237 [Lactobacillus selangorensis]KRN32568.1 hypothetical protein IV40_GL000616 [Lactobacillus selangorensis]
MSTHYQNILVPFDGSHQANEALDKAIQIALINHSRLDILRVIESTQYHVSFLRLPQPTDDLIVNLTKTTQVQLEDIKKEVERLGCPDVRVHVRFGNAKSVVGVDAPKDYQSDLIVMGAVGANNIGGRRAGSVAAYVVRQAPCDVIVVKTPLQQS